MTVGETPVDFEYANKDPFPPIDFSNYEDPAFGKLGALAKTHQAERRHCHDRVESLRRRRGCLFPMLKPPIGPVH